MNTPIYDFVTDYMNSGISRLHMPGHKGRGPLGVEIRDITEIRGADVLCEAEGIIGESEANATALFGTGHSFYSTEGSSLAIRAMLFLALQRARQMQAARPVVLAARNAHKAFLYACALLDCDIEWIFPEETALNSVCACHPTPALVASRLREMDRRPFAVYLTSPDYLGTLADVRGITDAVRTVCESGSAAWMKGASENMASAEIPVLVDNAHGAYLHFLPESRHPLDLGAYMSCDSAHKTLPVLTGGAYLQVSRRAMEELRPEIRPALSLFASTSPSYLILQSLDLCNAYLADGYPARLAGSIARIDALKAALKASGVPVLESEPLKLVIDASLVRRDCLSGAAGAYLAEILRGAGIEPEFADTDYLVLMLTPENPEEDYEKIKRALTDFCRAGGFRPGTPAETGASSGPEFSPSGKEAPSADAAPLCLRPLPQALSVREAIFSPHEILPVSDCIRRVCGQPTVSCPPAIPIAVSGEIITEDVIPVFLACGVTELSVVKQTAGQN